MANFRLAAPFTVPIKLLIPTYTEAYGVAKKTFPAPQDGILIMGSVRTFGGTEREVNGLYSVENTAVIDTWYRPDITSDCRFALENGAIYEVLGEPENVSLRNQFMRVRVTRVKGGA